MDGRLASAFADVCWRVWCESGRWVTPSELKRVVGEFAPKFSRFSQQDSHELLTFLLDGVYEDLNEVTDCKSTEPVTSDGTNDDAISVQG
jgi:ubiquitin carboxyl-terminal hydrolase 4/11/15